MVCFTCADYRINLSTRVASALTTYGGFDQPNINFRHAHHGFESSLGGGAIGASKRLCQLDRSNLPVHSLAVFAPTALTFLSTIVNDGIPIAVRFRLSFGCHLKRKGPIMWHTGPAIETDAGNPQHDEIDR